MIVTWLGEKMWFSEVPYFITDAYSAPRILRNAFANCSVEKGQVLLQAGNALKEACPVLYRSATVPGKVELLSEAWAVSDRVVAAAREGETLEAVCQALASISYFGSGPADNRSPGFFSKEIAEDLLEARVLGNCRDRNTYVVCGRGAVEGLQLMLGVPSLHQDQYLQLMVGLLNAFKSRWPFPLPLELHDVQFQLCQYGRELKNTLRPRVRASGVALQIRNLVQRSFDEMAQGAPFHTVSGRFREGIAEMEG